MDKHMCELEIIIGHSGYFYARCIIEDCDIELTSEQITARLNATQRILDAPDDLEAGIEIMKFWSEYRADILEGK